MNTARAQVFCHICVYDGVFILPGSVWFIGMITGKQFGRYEIRSKIGAGGMGDVYSAHDLELDRNVAIKLLSSEFTSDEDRKSRFRQEARVVSALNHPNIITIYEIGENEHGSFLATELIEGETLREIINRESVSLARILKIIEQAANALVAAHEAKIVHRDIKPENIMVRQDAIVKVLDFGLAKSETAAANGDNKTIPGTVMGSARYMSPEQARGLLVDERTDIWSLGVVLYEMLSGTAPFTGGTTADTIAAVIYEEPEPIVNLVPNTPVELQRILRKALQKEREERYQSLKDFALDIKDLLHEVGHTNSGSRNGHTTSSPEFTESPTMLHKTISANHPTGRTLVMTSMPADASGAVSARKPWFTILGSVVFVALLAISGVALYSWFGSKTLLAADAFQQPQISRVSTDGKVMLPAISPDGKYTAYVSGDMGSRSLVVRQLSTDSTLTVVPTTNLNFTAVTFSPNGDYVYYCQARSDNSVNSLFQVPTLGGTPKKLIEDVDSSITFSPDGKQFAFMRHTTKTNEDLIFVVDAATLESQQLIASKQTDFDFFSNRLAWSPDGKTILLGAGKRQNGFVGEMAIVEASLTDKNLKPLNSGRFFTVGNFAWFADGSGFVFAGRETRTGPVQIWRSSYPEIDFHQVTNDFNDYAEVGLSADGKTIVTMKGETNSSLWMFSPGGSDAVEITGDNRNPEGTYGLAQMPNGKLLYTRSESKEADIWSSDADGGNARVLAAETGSAVAPVISPDGRYIVYAHQELKSSQIWRMDADGKNPVRLSEESQEYSDHSPQVTRDGRFIIFHRMLAADDRAVLMKVSIDGGLANLFYSDEGKGVFMPRLSPDGKRIAFSSFDLETFEKKLMVATLNGDAFGQIERELEYNLINQVAWSPDGKSLTVLTSRAGTPNIWRQPIDGGAAKPITDFKTGRIFNFAWAADGKSLLIARGNTNNDLILVREADRENLTTTLKTQAVRRAAL